MMRLKKASAYLLAAILLASLCSAIGVSPASKTINFEPGKTVAMDFTLLNKEGATTEFTLSAAGELQDSLFFGNQTISLSGQDYSVPFRVLLKMPAKLEPGIHIAYFKLTPLIASSGDMFQAFVVPNIPIRVRVPYPSKYAVASIAAFPGAEGVPVPINLEFDNLGSESIMAAGGSASVYNSKDELVNEMSFPDISIPANSFAKSEGVPRVVLKRGSYRAEADAHYDSVSLKLEGNFSVGEPEVRVTGLATQSLYANEINKVDFSALLDWDAPVTVKGFLVMGSRESEMPLFELQPGAEQDVSGFVDTSGLGTGEHNLTIKLAYGSKIEEKSYPVRVMEHGAVEAVSGSSTGAVLALAVVIAVMLFVLFWLMRRKPPRQGENSTPKDGPGPKENTPENPETFK